ncbi:hypothetical protein [Noviherbaspirillum cavernae]|uniref:hypothetical protein n=1 Tax=Noviherbaspirillum cavernae TaxID=2320862 RepID=UPI001F5BEEFE|nr:hypothetical protein [Noviherbaspirillum cavernae]
MQPRDIAVHMVLFITFQIVVGAVEEDSEKKVDVAAGREDGVVGAFASTDKFFNSVSLFFGEKRNRG